MGETYKGTMFTHKSKVLIWSENRNRRLTTMSLLLIIDERGAIFFLVCNIPL